MDSCRRPNIRLVVRIPDASLDILVVFFLACYGNRAVPEVDDTWTFRASAALQPLVVPLVFPLVPNL